MEYLAVAQAETILAAIAQFREQPEFCDSLVKLEKGMRDIIGLNRIAQEIHRKLGLRVIAELSANVQIIVDNYEEVRSQALETQQRVQTILDLANGTFKAQTG